jgi:hypothetical protein
VEVPKGADVERRAVFTRSGEPGHDGGVAVAEHPRGGRDIEPFRQCRQDFTNAQGWGFQAIEWGITPRAEGGATRLAAQRLDALAFPVGTISNQGVEVCIGDPVVGTAAVGTGEALRVNPFGGTAAAFDCRPGPHGHA